MHHHEGVKGSIYEGGHRVPFMMRWDNGPIPKGETRSHLIGLNDLFATLCELAGVDIPEGQATDSLSFAEFIQNPSKTDNLRKHMGVWTYKAGILQEESIVRKDNLKLIRSVKDGQMQLFDVENDVSESKDLIDDDSYKEDVSEMLVAMKEIGPCYDSEDNFFVLEQNGSSRETNCEWFRGKIIERCNNYHEGQIQCRHTCSFNSPKVCSLQPLESYSSAQDSNNSAESTAIEMINGGSLHVSLIIKEEYLLLAGVLTGMLITMVLHFKIKKIRR